MICNAFTQVCADLSKACSKKSYGQNGAVALFAYAIKNSIYLPNIGDCRAILVKQDTAIALTEDGIAENPRFQKWHRAQGNRIVIDCHGTYRIVGKRIGGSMFARDIGGPICCRPKITKITLGNGADSLEEGVVFCQKGDFLILATDGLWDAATIEEVAIAVRQFAEKGFSLEEMAAELARKAGSYRASDNVTVQVIAI